MATLKEISELTNVAESTISRVLNRDPRLSISESKRTLVLETAEKLQYVTPRHRRNGNSISPTALRKPKALESLVLIHFLTSKEELSKPFYIGLRKGIEARCEAYGISTTRVLCKDFDPDTLHSARNSGVLSIGNMAPEMVSAIRAHDIPLVLAHPTESFQSDLDIAYVDVESASYMLCRWLLDRGIKRPALVGLTGDPDGRLAGYKKALEVDGEYDADNVFYDPNAQNSDKSAVLQIFERFEKNQKPFPDALIVHNDQSAVEVYQILQSRGIRVPEDISVVGFNDSAVASVLQPKLTTIRLDAGVIGESAVDLMMERLAGRTTAKHVQIQPTVMVRESSI